MCCLLALTSRCTRAAPSSTFRALLLIIGSCFCAFCLILPVPVLCLVYVSPVLLLFLPTVPLLCKALGFAPQWFLYLLRSHVRS